MNKSDTARSSSTHLDQYINIFTAIDSVEFFYRVWYIISTVVVLSAFETTHKPTVCEEKIATL